MPTFTNQATLSYNNIVTSSNTVTGQLVDVISVSKTPISVSYGNGDNIAYLISIVNSGSAAFTDMEISDNLGAYTVGTTTVTPLTYVEDSLHYYINGVLQENPPVLMPMSVDVVAGPPLVISGINVPANGNAILVYEASLTNTAPLASGSSIENTATLSGGGLVTPITADAAVYAAAQPLLTISKSICPNTVVDNGQITYTFVIQNSGNIEATDDDNIVVTDTFDPILNPITVMLNGEELEEGVGYTYDTDTGLFQTTSGVISVPAATYVQDPTTGIYSTVPGVSVLTVTGTV